MCLQTRKQQRAGQQPPLSPGRRVVWRAQPARRCCPHRARRVSIAPEGRSGLARCDGSRVLADETRPGAADRQRPHGDSPHARWRACRLRHRSCGRPTTATVPGRTSFGGEPKWDAMAMRLDSTLIAAALSAAATVAAAWIATRSRGRGAPTENRGPEIWLPGPRPEPPPPTGPLQRAGRRIRSVAGAIDASLWRLLERLPPLKRRKKPWLAAVLGFLFRRLRCRTVSAQVGGRRDRDRPSDTAEPWRKSVRHRRARRGPVASRMDLALPGVVWSLLLPARHRLQPSARSRRDTGRPIPVGQRTRVAS